MVFIQMISWCCESECFLDLRNRFWICKGCGAKKRIMTKDPEVIKDWLDAIRNEGVNLTKWEEDFVDSVAEQFSQYRRISDKQEEILERIYAERTP